MFILRVEYLVGLEDRAHLVPAHHTFLGEHLDSGVFLAAGQSSDRPGAVILARGTDRRLIESTVAQDPFVIGGCARYEIEGVTVSRASAPDLLDEP